LPDMTSDDVQKINDGIRDYIKGRRLKAVRDNLACRISDACRFARDYYHYGAGYNNKYAGMYRYEIADELKRHPAQVLKNISALEALYADREELGMIEKGLIPERHGFLGGVTSW